MGLIVKYVVGARHQAVIKGCNLLYLLWLIKLGFHLMLRVKLPVGDRIHPQSNKFAMGVENKATGD